MAERAKLTEAQKRVLTRLRVKGGRSTPYDLAYPRDDMMHRLFMTGMVRVEGNKNAWHEPAYDGFWVLTDAGRAALAGEER
jgi:hypothetical protein